MTISLFLKILILPLLWLIAANDVKTKRIPNPVHPVFLCAAIFLNEISPLERLLGAALPALFAFLFSLKEGKPGMGDVKLIFSLGWCLGLFNIPAAALAQSIFFFSTLGKKGEPIAYAPYLCGVFIFFLFLT